MLGLQRAFLAAGAATLLASLWTTSDASTAELMEHFYARLAEGDRPGAALRHAQRLVRARRAHAVHWAPFTLVGLP